MFFARSTPPRVSFIFDHSPFVDRNSHNSSLALDAAEWGGVHPIAFTLTNVSFREPRLPTKGRKYPFAELALPARSRRSSTAGNFRESGRCNDRNLAAPQDPGLSTPSRDRPRPRNRYRAAALLMGAY